MREIKFRAWQILNKRMICWEELVHYFNLSVMCNEHYHSQQYTGLKDQDKEEIYDGDILFDEHSKELAVVAFEEGKFIARFEGVAIDLFEVCDTLDIRGNIHENPELLEK